jgi:AAA domain, putative AbiEii toxin, Type IV TA system
MLERLHLKNVGPAPELEMEFAPRVNLITGDNGLGKSFLLDVAWWGLVGILLKPISPSAHSNQESAVVIQTPHKNGVFTIQETFLFDFKLQNWFLRQPIEYLPKITNTRKPEISDIGPIASGIELRKKVQGHTQIVIYQEVDGGFAISDSLRDIGQGAIIFDNQKVWDGFSQNGKIISNGLIRDWATWKLEDGDAFRQFKAVLVQLSPDENERLVPGKLTRISLDDARDFPTLIMPYGQEVPIEQASAGIKRVVSLAYMLVWTWQEHLRAAELTRQEPAREIVLLIDELEQHLHPRWQRVILPALLETVKELMKSDVRVQIIATTHSPLVMASLEPLYDDAQDALFHLKLVDALVTLEKMPWLKHGEADDWLISDAFGMDSSGSLPREIVIKQAGQLLRDSELSREKFLEVDQKLRRELGEADEFWVRWRYIGEKRGWL